MTAALGIADQGFEVHLVEKEAELGRQPPQRSTTRWRAPTSRRTSRDLIGQRRGPSRASRLPELARWSSITGHVGNFKSVLKVRRRRDRPVSHGVIIIATGGQERPTELYLHGKNPHVMTQRKLEARLAAGGLPPELRREARPSS